MLREPHIQRIRTTSCTKANQAGRGNASRSEASLYPRRQPFPELSRLRVVLVDDDPWVRTATAELLGNLGCVTRGFSRVESAVSAVLSSPTAADVVISDVHMPGMTGWQLLDAIRAQARPWPAVILSSGEPMRPPRHSRYRPEAFLAKPYGWVDLCGALRSACVRCRQQPDYNPPEHAPQLSPRSPELSRTEAEHSWLQSWMGEVSTALDEDDAERIALLLPTVQLELKRHFDVEERSLLRQFSSIEPHAVEEILSEHSQLRYRAAELGRRGRQPRDTHTDLSRLLELLKSHEEREEAMLHRWARRQAQQGPMRASV